MKRKYFSLLLIFCLLFFSISSCTSSKSLHVSNWEAFRKEWALETKKIGFMSGNWDLDWFDYQIFSVRYAYDQKRDGIKNFMDDILNWIPSPTQREQSIQSFDRWVDDKFQILSGHKPTADEIVTARRMGKNSLEAKITFLTLVEKCKQATQR